MPAGYQARPRPNPARSVKLSGALTTTAANALALEIERLRKQSPRPITLYINSGGGSIGALRIIENALGGAGPAHACAVVTVGQRVARSAAAYLLAMGDAAYAHRDATLHFHGVGCEVRKPQEIKQERAMLMAFKLEAENRSVARKLARAIAPRIARTHLADKSGAQSLRRLASRLTAQLASGQSKALVDAAWHDSERAVQFAPLAARRNTGRKSGRTVADTRIFSALRASRAHEASFDESATAELIMDYLFFQYLFAPASPPKTRGLSATVNRRIPGFGYFILALSRRLLAGECSLSAADACGLGLLDAVLETESGEPLETHEI